MDIQYKLRLAPYTSSLIERIFELNETVFGDANLNHIRWRLSNMPDFSIFTAVHGETLIGLKAGYAVSEVKYYSWLGGILPEYRRRGVASELMRRQHTWLSERGYSIVETACNQGNHPMAAANLQHGYSICGIRQNPNSTQVLFLKELRAQGDLP